MAISVPDTCSPRLAFLDDKGGHPPKQSMWHRLGLRKLWQGRDEHRDTSGESQDEISPRPSSDNSRTKQDNLTRRLSRKVGVGLPRTTPFKRQSSDLERLAPREPDHRRALSADRRPLSAQRTRTRSPPPAVGPRQSAPEVQWLGPPTTTTTVETEDTSEFDPDLDPDPVFETNASIDDVSDDWNPYPEFTTDTFDAPEEDEIIDLDKELEQRWILNLSMHFRDRSEREKFFVTYAETPNRWRRVTISCDYRDAPPDSLELELKELRYQRDKCARIYESIRESLLAIQFYDSVTNLRLETSDGRLHVHVTEDVNETIPYPPISCIGHLDGAPWIPEQLLNFESHLSGFVYKINLHGRYYIKKEIPGPDTVDEFLYEINALHALKGRPSVIQVEGIVVDEQRGVVKGLLISYAEQGALVDILYEQRGKTSFARRERWAKQIVQGLCEIHESGYVQGDFTLANIVVDADDNAKIIDINRRGCPVGWEPPEIAAKIESNQRISMYIGVKTDLFQLGMTLWALAMEEDEPERQPRPLRLADDAKIPDYYRRIVDICLSPTPRHRLSAKELLAMFPPLLAMFPPLLATRVSSPTRPLEIIGNDHRHMPVRNDWAQAQSTGLGLASPGDMMRHDDRHCYPEKEFSEDSYGDLPHPIFPENHDLIKRSTINLAEFNEDRGFSSKPSSSSTLNHHEPHNHDQYMDFSLHNDDQSPPCLPFDSQSLEATSFPQTRSMGDGFHNHPAQPPAFQEELAYLEGVPVDFQQGESNGQAYDHSSSALLGTATTVPPPLPTQPHVERQKEGHLTQASPNTDIEECDLAASALPINPTLREFGASIRAQSAPVSTVTPLIEPIKQSTVDALTKKVVNDEVDLQSSALPLSPTFRDSGGFVSLPTSSLSVNGSPIKTPKQEAASSGCTNTDVQPKFTEPTPSTSSLSRSGLPISPTFRSSEAALGVLSVFPLQDTSSVKSPKQDNADHRCTKAANMIPKSSIPSDPSSQPLSTSPIDPTLIRSWPSIDFDNAPRPVNHSHIESSKQEPVYSLRTASGVDPRFTEPSPATSCLSDSGLPISPTFRSSVTSLSASNISFSQDPSPITPPKQEKAIPSLGKDTKPTTGLPSPTSPRFSSALHMSSLRHTGASIGSMGPPFASSSVVGIGLLRRPWEQSSANTAEANSASTQPSGQPSPTSKTQAPFKSSSTITPAKEPPTEPQRNNTSDQSSPKIAETKSTWTNPSDPTSNLLNSNLPISPAYRSMKPNSVYAEAKMACATPGSSSRQAKPSSLTQKPLPLNRN
ncbi:hypothetical protein N7475_007169 [Penicillium sp. IBT 31633x]|nr:hypothetical protein N7475_007169 [Penicillium sp. IBT 31633x]